MLEIRGAAASAGLPSSGRWRISLRYIQARDTQTTPYNNMKQEERTPVRSTSAPNRIGRTKPPRPPARPTMPDTAPMFFG
ncbi:hypothetical protein D3C71_1991280 [compost metagenome]